MSFQQSLFDGAPALDLAFSRVQRIALDDACWVDFAPQWVSGSDALFDQLEASRVWGQRTRHMYDQVVVEPRLTAFWKAPAPLEPPILLQMLEALSRRYAVRFDSLGFNFYRDGDDSVAMHGDRISKEIAEPIVALVSLGEPRRFLLRPRTGGRGAGQTFQLGRGDLLVTGGRTQRNWLHGVPKVARAGPRISLAFRYGLMPLAY
jgi:alkylated DNA repair dioxygenase AlkB